jgi:NADH-quinone oxidoreductase subunit C
MKLESIRGRIEDGVLEVEIDELVDVLETLKSEGGFDYLSNLTAVDYQDYFQMIYNLVYLENYENLEVRLEIEDYENPSVPSVVDIWKAADWQEREVYDLFGINFDNHPNLKRILLTDDFEGHPLLKSY